MTKLPQPGGARYELREVLGRGGQGEVRRALDRGTGVEVAIKIGPDESAAQGLENELLVATALRHPAWPAALDLLPGERPALVLELVAGRPASGRKLPVEAASRLAVRLLLALRALHARGLLHGDLTPANVLLPDGPPLSAAAAARLLDLGLARELHRADGREVSGTPAFLAPEALAGGAVDERSDLHGLGLTLACLLAGTEDPGEARKLLDDSPFASWVGELVLERKELRPATTDAALELGIERGALEPPAAVSRLLAPPPALTGSAAAILVDALDRSRSGGRALVLLGGASLESHRALLDHLTARTLREGGRRVLAVGSGALVDVLAAERGAVRTGLAEELEARGGDTGARPLVLALQVDGESELDEATTLAAAAPPGSLVALLSERPAVLDELERRLTELEPARADDTRLSTEEVLDWLAAVLGGDAPAAGELGRALRRATGGEPTALARALEAVVGGSLLRCDDGGRWFAPDLAGLESAAREAAAPEAEADPRLRPLLALADWTREDWPLDAAAAAAGLDPALVQEALGAGRVRRGPGGSSCADSPAEARQAAGSLGTAARGRLAESFLDGAGPDLPVAVSARALSASGREAEAAEAWSRAGRDSLAAGRAAEAVDRLRAGRDAASRSGRPADDPASLEAGVALGRALLAAGRTGEARTWLEELSGEARRAPARARASIAGELAEACEQAGDEAASQRHAEEALERLGPRGSRSARAQLHLVLGRLAGKRREPEVARAALGRARELAEGAGDEALRARVLVEQAHAELLLDDLEAASAAAREAREAARHCGDDSLRGRSLQVLSRAAAARGEDEQASEWAEEAVAVHRGAGDLTWELNALAWLATLQGRRGRADRAAESHRRVLALARRVGEPAYEAATLYHLGLHAHRQGDWAEAAERLGEAATAWRTQERGDLEATARRVLANLLRDSGSLEAAEAEYDATERLLGPDSPLRPLLERSRAACALERGDAGEAGDRARAALEVHQAAGQEEGAADARRLLAEALLLRGHAEESFREADRAARLAADAHPTVRARALETRARARAVLPLGSPDAVPDAAAGAEGSRASLRDAAVDLDFRRALELHAEAGSPFDAARARLAQARVLLDSGRARLRGRDAAELQRALTDAAETLGRLGASSLSSQARALLGRVESGADEDTRTLATLYEVTRVLNSSLDRREVLERALDLLLPTLDVERAALILAEPGGEADAEESLRVAASRGVDEATSADALTYSRTVVYDVQGRGEPLVSPDATTDPRFARAVSVERHSIRSLACVPLRVGDQVRGALYVDDRRALRRFGEDDVRFLQAFADVAAPAIENARLVQQLEDSRDRLQAEAQELRSRVREGFRFQGMIGESAALERVVDAVKLVADSTASVLITGENGVGKELVARAVHEASRRQEGPFVALNCAALPETLLESELFGIEKGTATGVSGKIGKFEQAHGGTLFLDEIGDMSVGMQARLLRVLQERSFMRVGGDRLITVDVHVVAATNRDLAQAVAERTFREDLYYRLNVVPIVVPSLRERREDIPLLIEHFTAEFAKEMPAGPDGRPASPPAFSAAVRDLLAQADWPGNVRQLRNLVHRLVLLCAGRRVEPEDLPPEMRGAREEMLVDAGRAEATMDEIKRRYAKLMLERCGGNKRKTARTLGIAFKTLQGYLGD